MASLGPGIVRSICAPSRRAMFAIIQPSSRRSVSSSGSSLNAANGRECFRPPTICHSTIVPSSPDVVEKRPTIELLHSTPTMSLGALARFTLARSSVTSAAVGRASTRSLSARSDDWSTINNLLLIGPTRRSILVHDQHERHTRQSRTAGQSVFEQVLVPEAIPAVTKLTPSSACRRIADAHPDIMLRIYTFQTAAALDALQRNGVLSCIREILKEHSELLGTSGADPRKWNAYDWMVEQMHAQPGLSGGAYPVWAWIKRPSLTGKERRRHRGQFLITAIVPRKRLLISDYDQWHNCLNGGPVTISEGENCRLEQLERTDNAAWTEECRSTWARIFRFAPEAGEQPFWRLRKRMVLQACISEIRSDEVVAVRPI
ncbi:hypothetical protein DK847_16465 [Aestuariivirga litoralis]|uniref:DUF3841 domain-containing protein n=1 Tax=Aestuariivirga litoralis TaxID=2650924 RepID=A0A2W2AJZ6_9HYPH|nr:hypothetical protein DK847_16465 [Aestuariivirga litoralis]